MCRGYAWNIFKLDRCAPEKIERKVTTEFSPDQIAVYSFLLKSYRTLVKPSYRDMLAQDFYLEDESEPFDIKN